MNLRAGHTRQGGSTITQQVVKNVLLNDSQRTVGRKLREALLARRLESELTKDEILELYINQIYFGHGRYGIEEAARGDFGKSAKDLTIAEAALLAGRIARPESCSPRRDMKCALTRRAYVLDQMHEKRFLPDAQWAVAKEEPVRLAPEIEANSGLAPEVIELAKRTLREVAPDDAARGGFTITTTIDPRLQEAARKAIRDGLAAYDKRHGLHGALKAAGRPRRPPGRRDGRPPLARRTRRSKAPRRSSRTRSTSASSPAADDAAGTFDVQVGTVTGHGHDRRLRPLQPRAARGERVRSGGRARARELARAGTAGGAPGAPEPKVPLRLESGPEGALVALDVRTRQVLALVGNYEAASGGLDRATQSHRQPGSTFKPIVYSYAIHSRRYTPATLVDVTPTVFPGNYHPSNYEGWASTEPLRLREALANSVNLVAVRVLAGRRPVERRRVGRVARDSLDHEARPVPRARELRGGADRARGGVRDVRGGR